MTYDMIIMVIMYWIHHELCIHQIMVLYIYINDHENDVYIKYHKITILSIIEMVNVNMIPIKTVSQSRSPVDAP